MAEYVLLSVRLIRPYRSKTEVADLGDNRPVTSMRSVNVDKASAGKRTKSVVIRRVFWSQDGQNALGAGAPPVHSWTNGEG